MAAFTNGANGSIEFTLTGTAPPIITPKDLRKRARAIEKQQARDKALRKAHEKAALKQAKREKVARDALVAVAADETKGYARVWAARSLLGMDN